jgi:hypothetical protein
LNCLLLLILLQSFFFFFFFLFIFFCPPPHPHLRGFPPQSQGVRGVQKWMRLKQSLRGGSGRKEDKLLLPCDLNVQVDIGVVMHMRRHILAQPHVGLCAGVVRGGVKRKGRGW